MIEAWYLNVNGESQGPLHLAEIELRIREGAIGPDVLACHWQASDWQKISNLPKFKKYWPSTKIQSQQLTKQAGLYVLRWKASQGWQKMGPIDVKSFYSLIQRGELRTNDWFWSDGLSHWVRIEDIEDLSSMVSMGSVSYS